MLILIDFIEKSGIMITRDEHVFIWLRRKMNTTKIAQLANVSRSTVSRVINNKGNVAPEAKQRVIDVISTHGYKANQFARGLVGKSANIIGIYIADINMTDSPTNLIGSNSPYNMELLKNLIRILKARGYSVLVDVITDSIVLDEMEEHLQSRMLYGAIYVGFPYQTEELNVIADKGYNVVLIDQLSLKEDKVEGVKIVNSDNVLGGYLATKHLQAYGHTDIVYISGDSRLSSMEREIGYLNAMKECMGSRVRIISGMYREDVAYSEVKAMLKNGEIPTAFFAGNDIMAIGASRALSEFGLNIPNDVSIVGYDNLNIANGFGFSVTTLEISFSDIAQGAVDLLFSDKEVNHVVCTPKMIEKNSVSNAKT